MAFIGHRPEHKHSGLLGGALAEHQLTFRRLILPKLRRQESCEALARRVTLGLRL